MVYATRCFFLIFVTSIATRETAEKFRKKRDYQDLIKYTAFDVNRKQIICIKKLNI